MHTASEAIKKYIRSKESRAKELSDGRIAAYLCLAGKWTIGWGTTHYPNGKPVERGDIKTPEEVEVYFDHDIEMFSTQINRLVRVPIGQCQFDALLSFVYNAGGKALEDSTLLRKLNAGHSFESVAKQFLRWDKATNKKTGKKEKVLGLTKRREYEKHLFESCDAPKKAPDPNNTPLRNRDLPLPTLMRADLSPQQSTNTTPAVIATGGIASAGAVIELAGQTVPVLQALEKIDWKIICAIIGIMAGVGLVWALKMRNQK